jgi:hypothetical protein
MGDDAGEVLQRRVVLEVLMGNDDNLDALARCCLRNLQDVIEMMPTQPF